MPITGNDFLRTVISNIIFPTDAAYSGVFSPILRSSHSRWASFSTWRMKMKTSGHDVMFPARQTLYSWPDWRTCDPLSQQLDSSLRSL